MALSARQTAVACASACLFSGVSETTGDNNAVDILSITCCSSIRSNVSIFRRDLLSGAANDFEANLTEFFRLSFFCLSGLKALDATAIGATGATLAGAGNNFCAGALLTTDLCANDLVCDAVVSGINAVDTSCASRDFDATVGKRLLGVTGFVLGKSDTKSVKKSYWRDILVPQVERRITLAQGSVTVDVERIRTRASRGLTAGLTSMRSRLLSRRLSPW